MSLEFDINRELEKVILQKFSALKYSPVFIRNIYEECVRRLQSSPTYTSLLYGDLRVEFGLLNPQKDLDQILRDFFDNIKIEIGSLENKFIRVDINTSFINSVDGAYYSFGEIGGSVDWLYWLMNAGSNVVVPGFSIIYGEFESPEPSRTGRAIMVPFGSYTVPSQWAGTESDNWVTKALNGIQDYIFELIKREIQ